MQDNGASMLKNSADYIHKIENVSISLKVLMKLAIKTAKSTMNTKSFLVNTWVENNNVFDIVRVKTTSKEA